MPATDSPSRIEEYEKLTVIRSELGLVAGLALIAVIGARFIGSDAIWLTTALAVYAAWHAANLSRLLYWLNRPRFRTPVSYGVWEQIFNRLQEINLRNRKRKRDLFGIFRRGEGEWPVDTFGGKIPV